MVIAQVWGVGQVLWSIFWFFLFFLWIWLVISVFSDIMRSQMSGWSKALWSVAIIILPYVGIFIYLIANGDDMSRRSENEAHAYDEAVQNYIRNVAGQPKSPSDELADLAALHQSGAISDREYDQAKTKVISG